MDITLTCPFGSQCEEIKDNKVHRCALYVQMAGTNPNTGEQVNEWGCSLRWMPTLMVEVSQTNRGNTVALESFRNEVVKGQDAFLGLARNRIGRLERSAGEE